jgi:WD40 repeat protein
LGTNKIVQNITFPATGDVDLLAYSSGRNLLLHANKELRVWNAKGHLEKAVPTGDEGGAISHNGRWLASINRPKQDQPAVVRLWDIASGKLVDMFPEQFNETVFSIAFSSDDSRLAVAGHESLSDAGHTVKIRNVATWRGLTTITPPNISQDVKAVAFSPDGKFLASGGADMCVRIANVLNGEELLTLRGHRSDVSCVAFSPDGRTVASCSYDQTIRLWDSESGKCTATFDKHKGVVRSVAFSPDGRILASSGSTVKLWHVRSGRCLTTLTELEGPIRSVCFSPDGKKIATSGKEIIVWDACTHAKLEKLKGDGEFCFTVAFSMDGGLMAAGGTGGKIKLWNVATWTLKRTLDTNRDRVISLAFTRNGQRDVLAAPGQDGSIKVWEF